MDKEEIINKWSEWFSRNSQADWFGECVKLNRTELLVLVESVFNDVNEKK